MEAQQVLTPSEDQKGSQALTTRKLPVSAAAAWLEPPACVRDNVRVFNFPRMQWDIFPLASPVPVDKFSRYVWVAEELFCSGGGTAYAGWPFGKREAFLLSSGEEWSVTQLPNMLMPRSDQGLWWCAAKSSVLVFGGRD